MNYSSLAILSRCPQAPVPNLGQYDPQSISLSSTSSVSAEGRNDPSCFPASSDHGDDVSVTVTGSASVYSSFAAQRSTYPSSNVPATSWSGQHVPASGPVDSVADLSLSGGFIASDDDDFDDFKTAPTSTSPGTVASNPGLGVMHSQETVSG